MRRTPAFLLLLVFSFASPLFADDATDAAVKAIREMSARPRTFEVELVHLSAGGRQRVRTLAAYRGMGLCRTQFWSQEASKDGVVQRLVADRLFAGGRVTELRDRTVDEWAAPKYFFLSDYRLFPLYVDDAFRKCKLDDAAMKDGAIEIRWLNPEGERDKVITARFAPAPPHDMLSVATGATAGEVGTEIMFSEYTDVGGGFRFPTRMAWTIRNSGAVHAYPSETRTLRANGELEDSRFVLHIPKGATMPDDSVTDKPTVVNGNR